MKRSKGPQHDADHEAAPRARDDEALEPVLELGEPVIDGEERDAEHHEAGAEAALKCVAQREHEARHRQQDEALADDGEQHAWYLTRTWQRSKRWRCSSSSARRSASCS